MLKIANKYLQFIIKSLKLAIIRQTLASPAAQGDYGIALNNNLTINNQSANDTRRAELEFHQMKYSDICISI